MLPRRSSRSFAASSSEAFGLLLDIVLAMFSASSLYSSSVPQVRGSFESMSRELEFSILH